MTDTEEALPEEICEAIIDDLVMADRVHVLSARDELAHVLKRFPGARAAEKRIALEIAREAGRQGIALQYD